MANFNTHIGFVHCRGKGSVSDTCVLGQDDYAACLLLTPEQQKQLAMSTYKLLREKKSSVTSNVLIDPS